MTSESEEKDPALDRFLQQIRGKKLSDSMSLAGGDNSSLNSDLSKIAHIWNGESVSDQPLSIPHCIGEYRVEKLLGRGGFGTVFLGVEVSSGLRVAIKLLHKEGHSAKMGFFRESVLASELKHPVLIRGLQFGEHEGWPYIVMEYVEGRSLAHRIEQAKKGNLDSQQKEFYREDILRIALRMAEGLDFLHKNGIVHQDFKPGNVLVDASGEARLGDFGLSKLWGREEAQQRLGTYSYMSPEQARSEEPDPRSDIFSFGSTFYEAFTMCKAFSGGNREEILQSVQHDNLIPPRKMDPGFPRGLENFLFKCLEKDKAKRFQDTEEMLQALKKVQKSGSKMKSGWGVWAGLSSLAAILLLSISLSTSSPPSVKPEKSLSILVPERVASEPKTFWVEETLIVTEKMPEEVENSPNVDTEGPVPSSFDTEQGKTMVPPSVEQTPTNPPPQQSSKVLSSFWPNSDSRLDYFPILQGIPARGVDVALINGIRVPRGNNAEQRLADLLRRIPPGVLYGSELSAQDCKWSAEMQSFPFEAIVRDSLESKIFVSQSSGLVEINNPGFASFFSGMIVDELIRRDCRIAYLTDFRTGKGSKAWNLHKMATNFLAEIYKPLHARGIHMLLEIEFCPFGFQGETARLLGDCTDGLALTMPFNTVLCRPKSKAVQTEIEVLRSWLDRGKLVEFNLQRMQTPPGVRMEHEEKFLAAMAMIVRRPGDSLFVSRNPDLAAPPWTLWPEQLGKPLSDYQISGEPPVLEREFEKATLVVDLGASLDGSRSAQSVSIIGKSR